MVGERDGASSSKFMDEREERGYAEDSIEIQQFRLNFATVLLKRALLFPFELVRTTGKDIVNT